MLAQARPLGASARCVPASSHGSLHGSSDLAAPPATAALPSSLASFALSRPPGPFAPVVGGSIYPLPRHGQHSCAIGHSGSLPSPVLGSSAAHRADRRSSRGAVRRRRPVGPSPSARRRRYAGGGYGDAPGGAHAAAVTGGSGSRPARGDAPVCPVRQTSPHRTCGSMHA